MERNSHLADEYVGRWDQRIAMMFDHPLLGLRTWGLPDTRRVLVFRERCLAVVVEGVGPQKPVCS